MTATLVIASAWRTASRVGDEDVQLGAVARADARRRREVDPGVTDGRSYACQCAGFVLDLDHQVCRHGHLPFPAIAATFPSVIVASQRHGRYSPVAQRFDEWAAAVSSLQRVPCPPSKEDHDMFAALGIILLVAGAIITFAVDREAEGFDLHAVGWILMAGGGLALLIALIQGAGWMSARNTHAVSERHVSPDGGTVVEESHFN